MSCSVRTGSSSVLISAIGSLPAMRGTIEPMTGVVRHFSIVSRPVGAQVIHPALHVECGLYAGQGEPQLDERDGYSRLHANHDGSRIENARHARDVGDHASDERIDHFQG